MSLIIKESYKKLKFRGAYIFVVSPKTTTLEDTKFYRILTDMVLYIMHFLKHMFFNTCICGSDICGSDDTQNP